MIRLEDRKSPFGIVTIFRRILTGAVIYDQFEADRNGVSLASYIHAIYDLILQARAQTVLMIGCGGGTLGTMLARTGRNVTIVDVRFHVVSASLASPTCHRAGVNSARC